MLTLRGEHFCFEARIGFTASIQGSYPIGTVLGVRRALTVHRGTLVSLSMTDQKLQVIPLGGLGEFGMNMTAIRYRRRHHRDRFRHDVPRSRTAGRRPGHARSHLPQGEPGARPRPHPHPRPRGPHRRRSLSSSPISTCRSTAPPSPWPWWSAAWRNTSSNEKPRLNPVKPKQIVEIGPFKIEFIHVTHSIVSAVALAITTPLGVIIHTGDFKVDPTPTDNELFDLHTLADYGKRGVLLLLSDSTNSDRPGYTESRARRAPAHGGDLQPRRAPPAGLLLQLLHPPHPADPRSRAGIRPPRRRRRPQHGHRSPKSPTPWACSTFPMAS